LKNSNSVDIEKIIIENIGEHWKKVAMLVGIVLLKSDAIEAKEITDVIKKLTTSNFLEVRGDIDEWRFSEVRVKR
jgi:hypothetical protein